MENEMAIPLSSFVSPLRQEDLKDAPLPARMSDYPEFRYMGSKQRLLPWIHSILRKIDFETAADPFAGSGCVAYLLKCMGKRVIASDFLNFPVAIALGTVANDRHTLDHADIIRLLDPVRGCPDFIARTFRGVFFTPEDLRFLDRISANIEKLAHPHKRSLARAALIRSCLKKQPRGVFTITGDLSRYDDGRRDLRLSIEEQFIEQVDIFNRVVFGNGRRHTVLRSDVFDLRPKNVDLVYLDPPYVPRSDDNCYVKRYHFLEGLSCYWKDLPIQDGTKSRKIKKKFTPFSYRRTALDAFDLMFRLYRKSVIVLSYSSNGYPDLCTLETLMRQYKTKVNIFEREHRYHFGTHTAVQRSKVSEYLIVGDR